MSEYRSNRDGVMDTTRTFLDMLQGHMALDIERALKMSAGMPVKTGDMKAESRHYKSDSGAWRVELDKEYAAAQEVGEVNGHPIVNYTTPGTSAGFFQRAVDSVLDNRRSYIQEAAKAVGLL